MNPLLREESARFGYSLPPDQPEAMLGIRHIEPVVDPKVILQKLDDAKIPRDELSNAPSSSGPCCRDCFAYARKEYCWRSAQPGLRVPFVPLAQVNAYKCRPYTNCTAIPPRGPKSACSVSPFWAKTTRVNEPASTM